MFNDKYGLTQAVLKGRKTQTRRIYISADIIPNMQSLPQSAKGIIMARAEPHIAYTNQMLIIHPDGRADSWVPSSSDVFAEDWELVTE